MADPDEPRIYPCPLPACPWVTVSEPPGPAEQEGALAEQFGWGVFAAHAKADRLTRKERELRDHLNTHALTEFAIALAEANKRTALIPAESIALTVARAQVERGVNPEFGVTTMLVLALDRLTGRNDWTESSLVIGGQEVAADA